MAIKKNSWHRCERWWRRGMTCPSLRPNSEDTWPPATEDDLRQPRFPRIRPDDNRRPVPPELVPPRPPRDPPRRVPKPSDRGPGYENYEFDDKEFEPPIGDDPTIPDEGPPFKDPEIPPEIEIPEEPGNPPLEEPPLETPDGIDLERWDEGFEYTDDFYHEDYEIDSPDEDNPKLTPQPQEQESRQNARLFNLWFRNYGQGLVRQRLPGLSVNISALLDPQLRGLLEDRLLMEYSQAENYYANLFEKVFPQLRNGERATESNLFRPRVRPKSHGVFSDGDLATAAGVAITGIGILASYGFLYRGGRGGFIGRGAVSGLLDLSAP